jgi:DNA repair exonuclease SbcCD ATPase subunit
VRIAHVSDIHIRNLRYHEEYRRTFEDLYNHLEHLKPDVVINTGDTAHTKTQISPEFVQMASDHIRAVSEIAPYHIILGNHDLNLMNSARQDAITPIVESIGSPRVFLHKLSGLAHSQEFDCGRVNLWAFSLADREGYPAPPDWAKHPDAVNIGLFHGSVLNCVTDSNWRMTHVEHDLAIFRGLDLVLMGDIHKRQSFEDGRYAYPGSLIQQNFGEELEKGFLLWEIEGKEKFRTEFHPLRGSRKFYTIRLHEDLSFPDVDVEPDSRVRLSPPRQLTLVEQKEVERSAKRLYSPHDVITLSPNSVSVRPVFSGSDKSLGESVRSLAVQERLIREWLGPRELSEPVVERILDLNRKYQIEIDRNEETARDVAWRLEKLAWSNMFNYGEGNLLDFSSLGGVTGLFAPNGSGKSNLIDVPLVGLFDSSTKGAFKNIYLINDNKDVGTIVAEVTADGRAYVVERVVERIKYGQRKLGETKEWGKTSLTFQQVDEDGGTHPLNGESRPETERQIRRRLGTYDDLMLTAIMAQWNPLDVIASKETDRKRIFFKFLDLDGFEAKCRLAKEEAKAHVSRLKELEGVDLLEEQERFSREVDSLWDDEGATEEEIRSLVQGSEELGRRIIELVSSRAKVDRQEDVETLREELADLRDDRRTMDDSLGERILDLEDLSDRLRSFPEMPARWPKEAQLREIEGTLATVSRQESVFRQTIKSSEKSVKMLDQVPCGDQFPGCMFLVDAVRDKAALPSAYDKLKQLEARELELETQRDELARERSEFERQAAERRDLVQRVEKDRHTVQIVRMKISALDKEIVALESRVEQAARDTADVKKNKEIDAEIERVEREKREIDGRAEERRRHLVKISKELGAAQRSLEDVNSRIDALDDLRRTVTAYEHYVEAMGKDGVPYLILTQRLPVINEEINKILSACADFGVNIEHDPEEQSIRIYLQYGQYKPRIIELGGGAEKMLASIAIRVALLRISSLPRPNFFVIDEGFGKLDPRNLENIGKMFDYLRTAFDHIIVVSHLEVLKDMVDNTIEISVDEDGYAHVEVV